MNRFMIAAATLLAIAITVNVPVMAMQAQAIDTVCPPLTRAAVQAKVQERFAMVDANKDGVVTRAELDARLDAWKGERAEKRGERRAAMFAMIDTNKDGQLSKAEFEAARPPRDGKGPEGRGPGGMRGHRGHHGGADGGMGMRGGMGGGFAGMWFDRADANKDGKVTLAEASSTALARFDMADTNKDGAISPEERQAARAAMRAQWQAKRGG